MMSGAEEGRMGPRKDGWMDGWGRGGVSGAEEGQMGPRKVGWGWGWMDGTEEG